MLYDNAVSSGLWRPRDANVQQVTAGDVGSRPVVTRALDKTSLTRGPQLIPNYRQDLKEVCRDPSPFITETTHKR